MTAAGIRNNSQTFNEVIMIVVGKSQLIKLAAEKSGKTQKDAEDIINAFLSAILSTVSQGNEARLTRLFSIGSKMRKARSGRNPKIWCANRNSSETCTILESR